MTALAIVRTHWREMLPVLAVMVLVCLVAPFVAAVLP